MSPVQTVLVWVIDVGLFLGGLLFSSQLGALARAGRTLSVVVRQHQAELGSLLRRWGMHCTECQARIRAGVGPDPTCVLCGPRPGPQPADDGRGG